MNAILKIVLWIVSTLLITVLFVWLCNDVLFYNVDGFLFTWVLHFLLMSWYAFSLPCLNLEYKGSYYDTKPIEVNGAVYNYFGVYRFRWFLKIIGWDKISDKQNGSIAKNLNILKPRELHTREAELAHLLVYIHVTLVAILFLPCHNVFWLLLLNVFLHLYPVFVQRHNRPRYLKLIAMLDR